MRYLTLFCSVALFSSTLVNGVWNVVLSNDDGWAELNIRTFFNALVANPQKFSVVLSAPTENKSGTGSSDATPTVLNTTCEFNTCPVGSPAEGFNSSDSKNFMSCYFSSADVNVTLARLNWVNSFPVTSMRFGIQTLAPTFFGGKPDIAVAGPNVGCTFLSITRLFISHSLLRTH